MRKDPTQFRERFKRWKEGELVYENGLALPAYEDGKWNPNDTYTADAGMIKSKLAIASHFGNPTARRMTNYDGRDYTWPEEYEYINGVGEPKRGNVYVGSYDNLVTPQIQDNGKTLELVDDLWTPENKQRSYRQSLKFNKMRDAWSFGENYKKYAPMMNRYEDGLTPPSLTYQYTTDPIFDDQNEQVLVPNKKIQDVVVNKQSVLPYTLEDVNKDTKTFYMDDVYNRLVKLHPEFDGTLGFNKFVDIYNKPIIQFDKKLPWNNPGYFLREKKANEGRSKDVPSLIRIRETHSNYDQTTENDYARRASQNLAHEQMHNYLLYIPRTQYEKDIINEAYPLKNKYKHLLEEGFTTNTESRKKLSSDYGNVYGEDLNKIIDSLTDDEVIRRGIPNDYPMLLEKPASENQNELELYNKNKKQRAAAIRKAWKTVAMSNKLMIPNLA